MIDYNEIRYAEGFLREHGLYLSSDTGGFQASKNPMSFDKINSVIYNGKTKVFIMQHDAFLEALKIAEKKTRCKLFG
jgi:hypothetical protein